MGTDTSKSLFDQAMNDIMAGNYVAAEIALQQASEINEESTTLYAACWATLLALRGREQEAIEVLEERLETFSTDSNLLLAYGLALEKMEMMLLFVIIIFFNLVCTLRYYCVMKNRIIIGLLVNIQ